MNRYTLNIIPERDPVSKVDRTSSQVQRIRCTVEKNTFSACQSIQRSLCEIIMYACGSNNKPIFCDSYTKYSYPKPIPDGTSNIGVGKQKKSTQAFFLQRQNHQRRNDTQRHTTTTTSHDVTLSDGFFTTVQFDCHT